MADLPRGRIKHRPEDFVVEEIPAYAASGEGGHVFVRFTKRDTTTLDAVRALATALGCNPREAGFAGMKDKRAVTTQTISLQAPRGVDPDAVATAALALSIDGIVVHEAACHGNKLKPGHLEGNRFQIVVRDVPRARLDEVTSAFDRVARTGVPNSFGSQRFGKDGTNAERALAWLRGEERGPRDPRVRRLLWSSVQSTIFNSVLDTRVRDGSWATPIEGDLLKLRASGGLFVCSAVQTDGERAARGEVSPTGPIVGARMRWPDGIPGDLERRLASERLGEAFDLASTRRLGEGTRRALRMWVEDLRWAIFDDDRERGTASVAVYFMLPKGGYATTVLGAALAVDDTGEPVEASLPPRDDEEAEGP